jgi:hypothetical protein
VRTADRAWGIWRSSAPNVKNAHATATLKSVRAARNRCVGHGGNQALPQDILQFGSCTLHLLELLGRIELYQECLDYMVNICGEISEAAANGRDKSIESDNNMRKRRRYGTVEGQ